MVEFVQMLIPLLAFFAGGAIGEILAYKLFGVAKNSFVFIIDIILLVFVITFVFTYIRFTETGILYYLENFFIGAVFLPLIRGVESLLGLTRKPLLGKGPSIQIIQALSHAGLDEGEIMAIMERIGYRKKEIGKYEKFIEKSVPAYLPKFVKMEKMLESIESKIQMLEKAETKKKRKK